MTSIFDQHLPRNEANFAALSPLSFIERTAEVYPDRLAIVHGALRQTWAQTYARCRQLASALTQAGIGKNDTVAVMLPNTPPMVEAHFGVPMAGAVLNTLNTRLDPEAIARGCGISTRYLHELFRDTNQTLGSWIRDQRLNACREALRDPSNRQTVAEIAYRWGFSDQAQFSRAFKARFGMPPKEYRERARLRPAADA